MGDIHEPVREIPASPLDLVRETKDLERGFNGRLWVEGVTVRVGRPIAEEDESVVVSVHDKRTVLAEPSKPLDFAVGMKNAIGEGELGAGVVDEITEWNGEGSDGGIVMKLERAGRPSLLSSVDGELAIVWDVCPDLDYRMGVELSGCCGCGESEVTGMKGDV